MDADDPADAIPELRDGCEQVAFFADFCRYLAGNDVAPQAAALSDAARALLADTLASLSQDPPRRAVDGEPCAGRQARP
jgi:hypothetical protein